MGGFISQNKFIEKSIIKHGGKYDYSKVNYINSRTKVIIICPIHGEFEQTPNSHLSGSGCKKCQYQKISNDRLKTTQEFIENASKIYNYFYDYSKVDYKHYQ